jgi:hypothetical protein
VEKVEAERRQKNIHFRKISFLISAEPKGTAINMSPVRVAAPNRTSKKNSTSYPWISRPARCDSGFTGLPGKPITSQLTRY